MNKIQIIETCLHNNNYNKRVKLRIDYEKRRISEISS